jgi:tetratricopeptide (TPR) repeat protein
MVLTVGAEDRPARYQLHETLRQFGASQLDEAAAGVARAAHASYYLVLVGSGGPEPFGRALSPWLQKVELEFDNLRAVFAYLEARPAQHEDLLSVLVALRRYWSWYGRQREGLALLERALAGTVPGEAPVLRARALVTAAQIAISFNAEVCARYAEIGSELAVQAGDGATVALAAAVVAYANAMAGRANEAEGERALRLARQAGGPLLACEGLRALALSAGLVTARARACFEELLATAEEQGDIGFIQAAHINLCLFGFHSHDPRAARPHVERLMELEAEVGQESCGAADRYGEVLYWEGEYRGALVFHRRAYECARRRDLPWVMADAAVKAAACVTALGSDDVAAARLYGFAQGEVERAGFGDRYQSDLCLPATDGEILRARLGAHLADVLAEGVALTREEVSDLLTTLEKTVPAQRS